MASVTSNGTIRARKKPLLKRMSKYWGFYLMFIPVLVFVAVFHYAPMFGIRYAFYSWKIIGDPKWVGLANFEKLFSQSQFSVSFTNTIVFSVVKLLLNTGFAVIISLLLNEMISLKFKKLSQTIIYLPHFMSWVVTASVFSLLLSPSNSGLINQLLIKMGVIDEPVYYLADKGWWRIWYYIINVWRETGWQTIIFMATLTGNVVRNLPSTGEHHHHRADTKSCQNHEPVRKCVCSAE